MKSRAAIPAAVMAFGFLGPLTIGQANTPPAGFQALFNGTRRLERGGSMLRHLVDDAGVGRLLEACELGDDFRLPIHANLIVPVHRTISRSGAP